MTQLAQEALFHDTSIHFEKVAAETALPEDPNMWQDEILQELYKQVPYLADFDLEVVLETVDGERAYGLGHVEVMNKTEAPMTTPPDQMQAAGIRKARIPIIVKDGMLLPLDVVITDSSQAMPLTESRLRQAMFRPQTFDVTSKTPGDQSMIGQLYPPFRQNYGFGGSGGGIGGAAGMGGKTASAKSDLERFIESGYEDPQTKVASKEVAVTPLARLQSQVKKEKDSCGGAMKMGSVLQAVLSKANEADLADFRAAIGELSVKEAYASNVATYASLELLSNAEPASLEKRASAMLESIKPTVLQVVKLPDGYAIKTAHHRLWRPVVEHVDRGQLVQRVGTKIAMAADTNGAVTIGSPDAVSENDAPAPVAGPISAPGMYQVKSVEGEDLVGVVIPNLVDIDGTARPIALFMDGSRAAVQSDLAGVPVGEYSAPATVPAGQAKGHGVFYSENGGAPTATLPLELGATLQGAGVDDMPKFDAETFDGRPVQVSVQPYVKQVVNVDGVMLIPDSWSWLPLDGAAEVAIAETAGTSKTASLKAALSTVEVVAGGTDSYAIRGFAVEKIAAEDRQFLGFNEALFLLTGLGAEPEYAQRKLASALFKNAPEHVRIGHRLKTAQEARGESVVRAEEYLSHIPQFRHRMWKEAAVISDPTAVDAVLSLGFINPENVATYVGYLPTLDEAQHRLCELLIGARLGMRELSEGAIERAIRALEDVIEGLKVVAFQS